MFITEDPIACKMQKKMFALPENTNKALTLSEITNQMFPLLENTNQIQLLSNRGENTITPSMRFEWKVVSTNNQSPKPLDHRGPPTG